MTDEQIEFPKPEVSRSADVSEQRSNSSDAKYVVHKFVLKFRVFRSKT